MDHEAVTRSGLSGIDTYPYDPAWVLEGEYRAVPEGRRIEVASSRQHSDRVDAAAFFRFDDGLITRIEEYAASPSTNGA